MPARVAGERLLPLYSAPSLVAEEVLPECEPLSTLAAVKGSTYSVERNLDYGYRSLI